MDLIPVFRPLLEQEEKDAVVESLDLGWLGIGSYVGEFEETVKNIIGADDRYVVGVSTGHAALHIGLMLAGVGQGDEVITPSFNNIADFQAILACGADPVFCDIHDDTLCIDLESAERMVSPKTKAIIVMDYATCLCDHDAVAVFAKKHNLRVIHDAAHSLGSKYKGKWVGSFSDITMFSFDPIKTFTCIDGGGLVLRTEDEQVAAREMRLIGQMQSQKTLYDNQRGWQYNVQRLGYRYHLANPHAAIGLAQLKKFDRICTTRRATAQFYNEHLKDIDGLGIPPTDYEDITPMLYYVRIPGDERDAFRAYLKEHSVDTGIHWYPGHVFDLLKNCRKDNLSVTEKAGTEIVSLPYHSCMPQHEMEHVVQTIQSYFKQ